MAKRARTTSRRTNNSGRRTGAGLVIPAGLFIGMGIGALYNNFLAGMYLGLGIGFVVFLILRLSGK